MKKRFSLKNKLILIFGALIALASSIEGLFAVRIARKAVTEKVEGHLTGKAQDTAEIIDGRIIAFFEFLDGIARMPQIRNAAVPAVEKMQLLHNEASFNSSIRELYITDMNGLVHNLDGTLISYNTAEWFKTSISGKDSVTEPYIDKTIGNILVATCSVPVYDDNQRIIGVLGADIPGLWFSEAV